MKCIEQFCSPQSAPTLRAKTVLENAPSLPPYALNQTEASSSCLNRLQIQLKVRYHSNNLMFLFLTLTLRNLAHCALSFQAIYIFIRYIIHNIIWFVPILVVITVCIMNLFWYSLPYSGKIVTTCELNWGTANKGGYRIPQGEGGN